MEIKKANQSCPQGRKEQQEMTREWSKLSLPEDVDGGNMERETIGRRLAW